MTRSARPPGANRTGAPPARPGEGAGLPANRAPGPAPDAGRGEGAPTSDWPLWEVFIRSQHGLAHKHVGSLHAPDPAMALRNARDIYTRRGEGVSIWLVKSADIIASAPDEREALFDPAGSKVYRHPTFFPMPDEVKHI